MNYKQALAWIHSLYRFGSKPGLERIEELLRRLGEPHKRLRTVHITGTNGKGSTAALLSSILEAEGFRVGLYTSPYLESFTNRMAVSGREIGKKELALLATAIKPHVEAIACTGLGQPTEFEVVTAMAFSYFASQEPDWVVVEVGLGGRLDATNVILPCVSVITNVGLEHTQVLGDTVEKIAFEKAGIIKESVPVVTAADKPAALAVIEAVAAQRHAPLTVVGRDVTVKRGETSLDGQAFTYASRFRSLDGLKIQLLGRHQVINAACALAAREQLAEVPFSEEAARAGLAAARWPGRLEVVSREPLVILDGAHNTDGIQALREALPELIQGRKLYLVVGILADKAVGEILELVAPLATGGLIITSPDNPRAASPQEVAKLAARFASAPVQTARTVKEAVEMSLAAVRPGEALCVTGSLYTISEARAALFKT